MRTRVIELRPGLYFRIGRPATGELAKASKFSTSHPLIVWLEKAAEQHPEHAPSLTERYVDEGAHGRLVLERRAA